MVQLINWEVSLYSHRESWLPEYWYTGFGFGVPFCLRGRERFGTDDFSGVAQYTFQET